jgi:hypothetical protein
MTIQPVDRAFSDSSALVSYEDCVLFVQAFLDTFVHGDLKPWAVGFEPPLTYNLIVSLRKGKAAKAVPRVVQRILSSLGYNTQLINSQNNNTRYRLYFQFQDLKKLAEFQERVKNIKRQQQ